MDNFNRGYYFEPSDMGNHEVRNIYGIQPHFQEMDFLRDKQTSAVPRQTFHEFNTPRFNHEDRREFYGERPYPESKQWQENFNQRGRNFPIQANQRSQQIQHYWVDVSSNRCQQCSGPFIDHQGPSHSEVYDHTMRLFSPLSVNSQRGPERHNVSYNYYNGEREHRMEEFARRHSTQTSDGKGFGTEMGYNQQSSKESHRQKNYRLMNLIPKDIQPRPCKFDYSQSTAITSPSHTETTCDGTLSNPSTEDLDGSPSNLGRGRGRGWISNFHPDAIK